MPRLKARLMAVNWFRWADLLFGTVLPIAYLQFVVAIGLAHAGEHMIDYFAVMAGVMASGWTLGATSWRRRFLKPMDALVTDTLKLNRELITQNTKLAAELAALRLKLASYERAH